MMKKYTLLATALGLVGCAANVTDGSCAESLCGCSEPDVLSMDFTVEDEAGLPIAGIEAQCGLDVVATSNDLGEITFEVDSEWSAGCGWAACSQLLLTDPDGLLGDVELFTEQNPIEAVVMGEA